MGALLFSSHAHRDHESASLSAGSSPLPLLRKAAKTLTPRRHIAARFVCAPFTAVFCMKCARATSSDDVAINDKAGSGMELGQARRRPRLEELLRMEEASTTSSYMEHKTQDTVSCCLRDEHTIVVFGIASDPRISCTTQHRQDQTLPELKNHGATAIVPIDVDLGSSATASPAVPISASLPWAFWQALRLDMGRAKRRYGKLAGNRDPVKAELFYQRPILLGRRCRVQHLDESPYL